MLICGCGALIACGKLLCGQLWCEYVCEREGGRERDKEGGRE